jgi:hypothetical protein
MALNAWTDRLRELYTKSLTLYRGGNTTVGTHFTDDELAFLAANGLRAINVFDYVEDFADSGEPDWDTFLQTMSVRRHYFLFVQNRAANPNIIEASSLPPREATLDGIAWLPRIIAKAKCFLEGGLCHEIMFGCGGDRRFLKAHAIPPADFLMAVWQLNANPDHLTAFVRNRPEPVTTRMA